MLKIIKSPFFSYFVILFCFALPLTSSLRSVILGTFPFWFDPARDLLLAWGNINKITLIGPPSGIPGIFYGPYWVWWLSTSMVISKDPRWVDFMTLTLPYFTIFPFILYKFHRIFGKIVVVILWLLFIFAFQNYTTYIWNPHLAPLITLIIMYLLISINYYDQNIIKTILKILFAGICLGLLINFHISFGSTVFLGSIVFLIVNAFVNYFSYKKNGSLYQFSLILIFILGILCTYILFFSFEMRHGFQQLRVLFTVFSTNHSLVGYQGLSKQLIISLFFGKIGDILSISSLLANIFFITSFIIVIAQIKFKKVMLSSEEGKLILLSFCVGVSTLSVYLLSKNPIWNYHFIGVEIIFLLVLGVFLKKIPVIRYIALVWVIYLYVHGSYQFIQNLSSDPSTITSASTEEHVVNIIYKNSEHKPFAVYSYNSAIYTYEYDYLFRYVGEKNHLPQPINSFSNPTYIYLILPSQTTPVLQDFVHSHIPQNYKVKDTWVMNDKTEIIKAVKE